MINDKALSDFLSKNALIALSDVELAIGKNGEKLTNWQLRFNQLAPTEMYVQYHTLVTQLMQANMSESKRLKLFEHINKINERLLAGLHHIYKNQSGLLDEHQQQALDMVISVHYVGVMFYYSVWQRVANNPQLAEKKGLGAMFGLGNATKSHDELVQQCLYGMMSLLRQALFEKQIGYRTDTQVIWHWLNACYHFMLANGWQNVAIHLPLFGQTGLSQGKPLTLENIYHQCLFSEIINPYACRRPDMIMWQKFSNDGLKTLMVSQDLLEKPYLFINLKSNEPPKLHHADLAFNPFAKDSDCLFLGVSKLVPLLQKMITKGQNSDDMNDKIYERFAKIMLENLKKNLTQPESLTKTNAKCQTVIGFYHIHYMLANKASLGNLIQAHELPERLRPKSQNNTQLNKSTVVNVVEKNHHQLHLMSHYAYTQTMNVQNGATHRNAELNALSYLQVGSMVGIRMMDDANKTWLLGRIDNIAQTPIKSTKFESGEPVELSIDSHVKLFGKGMVPCGVRLYHSGTRPQHFVPALMIPKNAEFNREKTTIMIARLGYQVDEKLIMRIDNKEVNIRLTELLNMTDDVEEYAFVRVQ